MKRRVPIPPLPPPAEERSLTTNGAGRLLSALSYPAARWYGTPRAAHHMRWVQLLLMLLYLARRRTALAPSLPAATIAACAPL